MLVVPSGVRVATRAALAARRPGERRAVAGVRTGAQREMWADGSSGFGAGIRNAGAAGAGSPGAGGESSGAAEATATVAPAAKISPSAAFVVRPLSL